VIRFGEATLSPADSDLRDGPYERYLLVIWTGEMHLTQEAMADKPLLGPDGFYGSPQRPLVDWLGDLDSAANSCNHGLAVGRVLITWMSQARELNPRGGPCSFGIIQSVTVPMEPLG